MNKSSETVEIGFSGSRSQFKENLEERGIDTDYLFQCDCGHFHTVDELVAAYSIDDEEWYKCKACIGIGNEDEDCFDNGDKSDIYKPLHMKIVGGIKSWL